MESLREDDLKGMNASAGGLVWVRRRNGSWWPGRILCVDELAKCLRSKKAGTPIKLLGKEEGTVDWYNLEKSKRIKAFRCGEYDDCIEKAKASAIRSNRRRANSGKHARRVDAILHALELEKCHLTDGNAKLSFSKNSSRVSCIANNLLKQQKMIFKNRRELVFTARKSGKPKEICIHELSHSVTSSEQPEQPLNSTIQEKRWKNPNDSEDDGDDGIRRMKDLQDLSLGMTLTGKPNMRDSLQEFCAKGTSGRASQIEKDFANNLCSISLRSSFKHPYTRLFHAYQNLRRRNRRRRQLTKICVSSDKVNVPLIYQGSVITGDFPSYGITMKRLNDLKSSSKKTKFSFTDNGSFNFSESSQEKTGTTADDFNHPSVAWDEADDSLSNGLVNVPILIGERNVEGALSLRKARPSRKIHSYAAEKLYSHSVQVCLVSKSCQGLVEASSTNSVSPINHIVQSSKKSNIRLYSKAKEHSSHSSLSINPNSASSEDEAETACDGSLTSDISDQSVRCGSLTELSNFHESQTVPTSINSVTANEQSVVSISPRCARLELSNSVTVASLYEVELKVQANNYHGQRAPLVSLVSKLNGKAIVGHTIAIDVVDDGSSAALLNSAQLLTSRNKVDIICNLREKLDYLTESKLTVQEKKSHLSCTNSPLLKRKLLSGRKSGFSPRKIRRLSAITVDLNNRENDGEAIVEEAEASSVSCVPLRVVFSRLDEALRYSSHQER